jgi:4-oxalocrotonate tautomerase
MPHIDIKCYPKHLTQQEFTEFINALTDLAVKHLKAEPSDVSINYTEIAPENWKPLVYDREIRPNLPHLAKRPGYAM